MRNTRRVSMFWVLAATALVWLLALLPILHVFLSKQFTQSEVSLLMGYAPNQFLFILLLPFPLAAFLTFVARTRSGVVTLLRRTARLMA
ncbi:hypothetical protein NZK33_21170, partial [Cyanobium sp. FGCU-6]|nr:hypothetical protein [Cyanobium sp. FGCU6]